MGERFRLRPKRARAECRHLENSNWTRNGDPLICARSNNGSAVTLRETQDLPNKSAAIGLWDILLNGVNNANHPGCSGHKAPESRRCGGETAKGESIRADSSGSPGTPQPLASDGPRGA